MIALLWGEYLPEGNEDEIKNTEKWRVLWFYFPLALFIFYILLLIIFLKNDSIKHLIRTGNKK